MEHPLITGGGEVVHNYNFGGHKGVLVKTPESFGPIKYIYVLLVFEQEGEEPILFVTSEKNEMQSTLLAMAAENDPELASDLNPNECFLGVFSKSGRENHGGSMDWCDFEKFEKKALEIVSERLGIVAEPNPPIANNPRKPPSNMGENEKIYPIRSGLLAILATGISFFVAIVGHILFYLFDELRGVGDEWMQTIFRELLMPGVGGYVGIYVVHHYFERYTKTIVVWIYGLLLVTLYLLSWFFVLQYAQKAGISGYDLTMHFLSIISAAIGVYIGNRTYWSRL